MTSHTQHRAFIIDTVRDKLAQWDEEQKRDDNSYKRLAFGLCINYGLTLDEAWLYIQMAKAGAKKVTPSTVEQIQNEISNHIADPDWDKDAVTSLDARAIIVINLCEKYDVSFKEVERIFAVALKEQRRQLQSARDKQKHLATLPA